MNKISISENRDYAIPCIYNINGTEKQVCVVIHGFGSHKESPTAKMMVENLPKSNIGAIAFDFPAHGESDADGRQLRIASCVDDLAEVTRTAESLAPNAEIVYFASSYGAYIVLIYLAKLAKERNEKPYVFLRSAAINMPGVVREGLTAEQKTSLENNGEFTLTEEEGYTRALIITQGFIDDLECHDVFNMWDKDIAHVNMIHGDADEVILYNDAKAFAEKFNVPMIVIPNGDHQLSLQGMPEMVLKAAIEFFAH